MNCPRCGLWQAENALQCECGYAFAATQKDGSDVGQGGGTGQELSGLSAEPVHLEPVTPQLEPGSATVRRTTLPTIAGVIYLVLATGWFALGLLQLALPSLGADTQGVGGTDLRLTGAWNVISSLVYALIGVFLTRRSKRAYSWGLWSAVLSMISVPLTGGLNCVTALTVPLYVAAAIILCKSRLEFGQPSPAAVRPSRPKPLQAGERSEERIRSRNKKLGLILAGTVLGVCALACVSLALLGNLVQSYSTSARAYYDRGTFYKQQGDLDRAIAEYTRAIELDPRFTAAYNDRGCAFDSKGDYVRAIADFDRAIELDPTQAFYYRNRGLSYRRNGDLEKAIADGTRAVELDNDDAEAYYARGIAYSANDQPNLAVADYTRALELDPKHADAYYNRGLAHLRAGNLDQAIADNTRAIELANFPDAYLNRGRAYELKQNIDQALSDYTRAVEIAPRLAQVYHNRGGVYYQVRDYENALADYNKAIELEPMRSDFYLDRGILHASIKNLPPALTDLTRSIDLEPGRAATYLLRGMIYRETGDVIRATIDFQTALALGKDAAVTEEARTQLNQLQTPAAVVRSTPTAVARARSVVARRRDIEVTILKNSDVQVVETWQVQFNGGPFSNAFRGIELYKVDSVTGMTVAETGQEYQESESKAAGTYHVYQEKNQKVIEWFYPPTLNSTRTFVLHYTLKGVIRVSPTGDQFWWWVIESDRAYPIDNSTIAINLPASFALEDIQAQVTRGSALGPIKYPQTVSFITTNVAGGSGLEILVQFPHGAISGDTPSWQAAEQALGTTTPPRTSPTPPAYTPTATPAR